MLQSRLLEILNEPMPKILKMKGAIERPSLSNDKLNNARTFESLNSREINLVKYEQHCEPSRSKLEVIKRPLMETRRAPDQRSRNDKTIALEMPREMH